MAGLSKPTDVKQEMTDYIVNGGVGNYNNPTILFNGSALSNRWDSATFYWKGAGHYVDITLNRFCNLYTYGAWGAAAGSTFSLIEKLVDDIWVNVTSQFKQLGSVYAGWVLAVEGLTPGRYRFRSAYKIDSEWYFESIESLRLIKQNGSYYTINEGYYNFESLQYNPLPSADFSKGFLLGDLFKNTTIGGEKTLAPTMTSNTTPSPYVISSSSEYSATYSPWKAFNGIENQTEDCWATANNATTGWIQIDMGKPTTINTFCIVGRNELNATYKASNVKDFTFEGSNNGIDFTILKTVVGQTDWSSAELRRFTLDSSVTYRYYKINITANNGGPYVSLNEIKLIHHSSIENTFNPIDKFSNFSIVTQESFDNNLKIKGIKSISELIIASGDINLSIADNIDYFKILQTKLDNGEVKIVLSTDSGVTWKTYNETDGFININNIIPVKPYDELTIEDEGNIELAKEEILQIGISIDVFNTLDFNILNSEIIRFAYVIRRPSYTDSADVLQLDWSFDSKGYMEEMQDSEGDFLSYDYSTRFVSTNASEMIKLTAML